MGYVIKWRSTITDIEGQGARPLSLFVAQAAAEEMNVMYPEVHHWVELYEEKAMDSNDRYDFSYLSTDDLAQMLIDVARANFLEDAEFKEAVRMEIARRKPTVIEEDSDDDDE